VSAPRAEAAAVVSKNEYKRQLGGPTYSELANSFLCKAMVDQESKDYSAATWAFIHAAWVCDDSNQANQATMCRKRAADMLIKAEEHGQQVVEQERASTAILSDLLRRSGRLEQARQVIATRRGGINEDIIVRILDFQTALLNRNDVSCHTSAEALEKVTEANKPM
jgi:hypothetical protein